MSALPYPTKTRLRLAEAIAAGTIRHYHWEKPVSSDERGGVVTARVAEFVNADPPLATLGTPDPAAGPGFANYSYVALTPAGEQWLESATSGEGPGSTSPEPGPPGGYQNAHIDGMEEG